MTEMDPPPPSGIVTYVFTDIEGSTRMTRALEACEGPGAYETKLGEPHRIVVLRETKRHGGIEVQRVGDGHMLVFPTAEAAIGAMVNVQRSLHNSPIQYKAGGHSFQVKIRAGVHTSVSDRSPKVDGRWIEYPGEDTIIASRIGSLGKGGQVLVSEETRRRLGGSRDGWEFHTWPDRLLKDFDTPEALHELLYRPDQEPIEPGSRFFPSFYLGGLNRYVERPVEERKVLDQLQGRKRDGSTSRLVTIWGEGGMGKTRLGVACAVKMAGLFPGGVHWVDLATCEPSRAAVAEEIGLALGLQGVTDKDLARALRDRPDTLILLDNVEAVICDDVARLLASLVTQTRGIALLAMSRQKVGVRDAEQLVSVNEGMSQDEALELFLARARLDDNFDGEGRPEDEKQIRRILALTLRIPMAVELAAGWVGDATLKEIADGLEARPLGDFAANPPATIGADDEETRGRHAAVERSLDWSYGLLGRDNAGADLQSAFAACGLFAVSFTAEAASAVLGRSARTDLVRVHQVSLIRREKEDLQPEVSRFSLHRFTREYALRKLDQLEDTTEARRRLVIHHLPIVENDGMMINDITRLAFLDLEWPNVVAAAAVAGRLDDYENLRRLSSISIYLNYRGRWAESERLTFQAIEAARLRNSPRDVGAHINNLGIVYRLQGRWGEAEAAFRQSLEICREQKDRVREGQALNNLGIIYGSQGRLGEAEAAYKQSLEICREQKDRVREHQALNNLGGLYHLQGRLGEAEAACKQSMVIRREHKDRVGEGQTLNNLALVYRSQGRLGEAEAACKQSLEICREHKDRVGAGQPLNNLGIIYRSQGRWGESESAFLESLEIKREYNDRVGEGVTLENLATLWESQSDYEQAMIYARESVAILETTQALQTLEISRQTLARIEANRIGNQG